MTNPRCPWPREQEENGAAGFDTVAVNAADSARGREQEGPDQNDERNSGNDAMKQQCDISMKHSKISDEAFSGVCSTLKAVTDWMQLFAKRCV